ncbi:MAG: hypothetical protein EBV27_08390 [Actinobacteria bacterium]|nr:hypothetical protein [Actinomycetota bacterium]
MAQGKRDSQIKDSENFAFWGIVCLIACVLFLVLSQKKEPDNKEFKRAKLAVELLKRDRDSLVHLSDSLTEELFPTQIELNRYQMAYKIFLKRDPQGAKIFGDIISDETE